MAWGLLWGVDEFVRDGPRSIGTALLPQMASALGWVLFTPGILWLGRRWPLEGRSWPLRLGLHVGASSVIVLALDTLYHAVASEHDDARGANVDRKSTRLNSSH